MIMLNARFVCSLTRTGRGRGVGWIAGWLLGWMVGHWAAATRRRSCSCRRRHAPLTDSPAFMDEKEQPPWAFGCIQFGFKLTIS